MRKIDVKQKHDDFKKDIGANKKVWSADQVGEMVNRHNATGLDCKGIEYRYAALACLLWPDLPKTFGQLVIRLKNGQYGQLGEAWDENVTRLWKYEDEMAVAESTAGRGIVDYGPY